MPRLRDHVGDVAVHGHVPAGVQVDEGRVAEVDAGGFEEPIGERRSPARRAAHSIE